MTSIPNWVDAKPPLTKVQLGEVDAGMDYVTDVDYVRSADGIRALTAAGFTQP